MSLVRALARGGASALLVASGLTAVERPIAPAQAVSAAQDEVLSGHRLYFAGKPEEALKAYQAALRRQPNLVEAWVNGAVVYDSMGEARRASDWYRRALKEMTSEDPQVRAELGELELRRGRFPEAQAELEAALKRLPADPHALIARGRVALAMKRSSEAVQFLERATASSPASALGWYWLGLAREDAGDFPKAVAAYDRAASADNYFTEARFRLARVLARAGRIRESLEELDKLLANDGTNEGYLRLATALRPRLKDSPRAAARPLPEPVWIPPARAAAPAQPVRVAPPTGRVPMLRVGIGTTALGHPVDWRNIAFEAPDGFEAVDAARGRKLAGAAAGQRWEARARRMKKKGSVIELVDPLGQVVARARGPLLLSAHGTRGLWLREKWPGGHGLERRLRGRVELSLYKEGLKVVDIVDLESYTHGVLSAEMPVDSPMEALKAQAVLARTHALYMRQNGSRHKGDGYELCDGQHCQVYGGLRAESERSRAVVEGTRGRIVTYKGRPVNVLYSSDCGGHGQGSSEVSGWGDTPYFVGRPDAPQEAGSPWSPWELRRWLRTVPPAYCAPSTYVHPSHFRWARVVSQAELEARLDRSLGVGHVRWVQPLRRARSGHLNSIEVRGEKATRRVASEIRIRNLLGPGSQRSSLFIMDAEVDARGRPVRWVFYGGGWGHGVGFCQSGAMGRAVRGQDYAAILRAYYTDVEIGSLRY